MALNFLRNPFERLTVENQEDMKKNTKELKEYFTDASKNTIVLGLANIEKELKGLSNKVEVLTKKVEATAGGKIDQKELKEAGKSSILLGDGINKIITAIRVFSNLPDDVIDKFVQGISRISGAFEKLSKTFKTIKEGGQALMSLASGIFWFGVSLLISGPIYLLALPLSIIVVGVIMGVTWLFTRVMADKKTMDGIAAGGRALAYIALGIITFGLALLVAGPIFKAAMSWSLILVVGVITVTLGLIWLIGSIYDKNIQPGIQALMWMGVAIVAFGIALVASSMIYSYLWKEQKDGMLITGLVILTLVGVMYLISKIKGEILEGAMSLAIMSASVIILAVGLWMFSHLFPANDQNWETLALIGATIGGLTVVVLALGLAGKNVIMGAIAMIVVSASLIVLSLGLSMFQRTINDGYKWEEFGLLMATIGGLAIEFGIIGIPIVAGAVALGAGVMMLASASIMVLSKGLDQWRKVGFKDKDAQDLQKAVVRIPMAFLGLTGDEGFFEAIKVVGQTTALMAAASLNALMMVGISYSLISISKGIESFQKLNINFDKFGHQIVSVTHPLITSFGEIGREYGGSGLFGLGAGDVYKGINSVMGMGNALNSIAMGVQSMAELKFPIYGKDGEIESYFGIDSDAMTKVTLNIGFMVSSLSEVFRTIGANDESSWWSTSDIEKGINMVKDIGTPIANLATGLQGMADLRFPKEYDENGNPISYIDLSEPGVMDNVVLNIGSMITALNTVYKEIGANDESRWWSSSDIEKGINMVKDIGTPIASLATGLAGMADLRFPVAYDSEGNPTDYIDLNKVGKAGKSPFDTVTGNIKRMIQSLTEVFTEIGEGDDSGWFSSSTLEKGIEMVMSIGDPLNQVANFMSEFAKTKIEDFNIRDVFIDLFAGLRLLTRFKPNEQKEIQQGLAYLTIFTRNVDAISKNAKDLRSIDKSFNNISKSMGVFKDNVNALDIKLLSETKGLFEAMAVISEAGTADQIMAKYGKTLDETFKNLASLLEEFGGKVTENTEQTSAAIATQAESNQSLFESIQKQKETAMQAPPAQNAQTGQMLSQLREIATILRGTIKVKDASIGF